MKKDDPLPPRGRPRRPSLSSEAVHILKRNAFAALRGPNSRGAVPRSAFVDIDVSTVDRSVIRAFSGDKGRTPFDLASHHVSQLDGGLRSKLQIIFQEVERSFRETDQMEATLRVFLKSNYLSSCSEDGWLAAFIVQTAACAHMETRQNQVDEQTVAAQEIVDLRQGLYAEMTDGFVAGLTVALRRLRRRPIANRTLRDIVLVVTASVDGFVLLHKLQPDLLDPDLAVDAQWNIIWGLTEPGLLDPPNPSNHTERDLVEAALVGFSSNQVLSIEQLAQNCGVSSNEATELFPTDEALAQRCMDYAVGSSVETQAIALNVKGAELSAVRDLLIATTRQATATPLLIELLQRTREDGFCGEARRHIAEALSQSEDINLDRSTADGVAVMLLDAALQGDSGKPIWEAGLGAFAQEI